MRPSAASGAWVALPLALLLPLTGCGSNYSNPDGTPAGTYTYTVTATSGALSHSQTITLTVQ